MNTVTKLVLLFATVFAFSAVRANAQEKLFRSTIIGSNPGEIIAR